MRAVLISVCVVLLIAIAPEAWSAVIKEEGCNSNKQSTRAGKVSHLKTAFSKIHLDESSIVEHCGFRPGGAGPEKLLQQNKGFWNPNPPPWYVIFDFKNLFTVEGLELSNVGDVTHDVSEFTLETADNLTNIDGYKLITRTTNVEKGTNNLQRFTFTPATGRYWKFTITKVHSQYQPWVKELTFHGHPAEEESADSSEELECPEGFFIPPGSSHQCFKFFGEKRLNWFDANIKCGEIGLRLAKPYNALALRAYLFERYGPDARVHVGARGIGSKMVWEHDGRELGAENTLWRESQPGNKVTTNYCLEVSAREHEMNNEPEKPYWPGLCSIEIYTLCEFVE